MNKPNTTVPSNLVLTALLSSGITIVVSICYIVLSILGLIYRFNCNAVSMEIFSFWSLIYRVYIQDTNCEAAVPAVGLTQSHTVFVFLAITLCFSTLTLVTGIVLAALINNKEALQYINVYVYAYIASWVGSLVVDVTFGTHLGMDYTHISNLLVTDYDPNWDLLRQGSFYLLAISLKGFAIHAVNLVLILLMIVFLYDYQDISKRNEHSIHKVGALDAFEQPRRQDDNWGNSNPDMYAGPFARGQLNSGFIEEEPRTPIRNDYNNSRAPGSFRRSDSWNHQQPTPQPMMQSMPSSSSSRPFSYLEEVRRPTPPVKPPMSPTEPWRGGWPAPPVPAPDYSPHSPRRLKSALKPNYM